MAINQKVEAPKELPYEPRSPDFYVQAVCAFTRALRHPSIQDADSEQAEQAARTCAKVLDSGIVPRDYHLPKTARLLELVLQKERLSQGGSMNSAERFREQAKLEAQGPIPRREEVLAEDQQAIESLKDVSLSVRQAAFLTALSGISAQPTITGAREDAALGIVVESLLHAIKLHQEFHLPVKGLDSMTETEQAEAGASVVPWPVNYAVEIAAAMRDEILANQTSPTDADGPEAAAA